MGEKRTSDTPRTFIGAICAGEVIDFVIVEVVVEAKEETALDRAMRKWGMKGEEQSSNSKLN